MLKTDVELEMQDIAEFEFYLLEELSFLTVVFHPFMPLDKFSHEFQLDKPCLQAAWMVVNDTYKTDLLLNYPPHLIALAAIYITVAVDLDGPYDRKNAGRNDVVRLIAEMNVDMVEV